MEGWRWVLIGFMGVVLLIIAAAAMARRGHEIRKAKAREEAGDPAPPRSDEYGAAALDRAARNGSARHRRGRNGGSADRSGQK